jgi:hypothetical protein
MASESQADLLGMVLRLNALCAEMERAGHFAAAARASEASDLLAAELALLDSCDGQALDVARP